MCEFLLEAYDVGTEELHSSTPLPGYREEDCMMMFQLTEEQYEAVRHDSHTVTAAHKDDLELITGQKIDLNKYVYFVDLYESDPLGEAIGVLKDLVSAADYLRSGGALDCLGHAPDGGRKWYDALENAGKFLSQYAED